MLFHLAVAPWLSDLQEFGIVASILGSRTKISVDRPSNTPLSSRPMLGSNLCIHSTSFPISGLLLFEVSTWILNTVIRPGGGGAEPVEEDWLCPNYLPFGGMYFGTAERLFSGISIRIPIVSPSQTIFGETIRASSTQRY